jgi:hypothetical protein
MRISVLVAVIVFISIVFPASIFAHDNTVVIPLVEEQRLKPTASTFLASAYHDIKQDPTQMIKTDEGECFLHKVLNIHYSVDGSSNTEVNSACIIKEAPDGYWVLQAVADSNDQINCTARCIKW